MLLTIFSVIQLHPVGLCITCAHQNTFGFLDNNVFWVGRKMNHCMIHLKRVQQVCFNLCKPHITKSRMKCQPDGFFPVIYSNLYFEYVQDLLAGSNWSTF